MAPPRRLAHAAGTFLAHPTCAPAEVRMDTFGAGAQSRAARSGRVAAALPFPALCAAGRRHGELRRRWRRGRAALRFLRRVSSAGSGTTPMERRPAARSATRSQGAPEDPAQLPSGKRMAARAGGHALPAARLGARGRRARARLHLFDRLSGAVSSGSRAGISRLPPGAGGGRRAVRGPGSRACAPRRGDSERDGATGCRRSSENSLAHEGRRAFSRRVPVRAQAPNRVFAAAQSTLARELRPGVPRRGLRLDLRTRMLFREPDFFVNGERVEPPGRSRRVLARLADGRALAPGMRLPHPLLRLLYDWYLAGWLRVGERHE